MINDNKNSSEELEKKIDEAIGGKVVIFSVERTKNENPDEFDIKVLKEKAEKAAELLEEACND
ncbi:MAG: hypothetical protein ACOZAR_00135 [Patescibacteria group bacterium]